MARTTAQQLDAVDTVISGLEDALADNNVEEYRIGGRYGRTIRRAEFAATLQTLYAERRQLISNAADETARTDPSRSRVRVAKIGRARPMS